MFRRLTSRAASWWRSWRDSRKLCRALVKTAEAERRANAVLHRLAGAERRLKAERTRSERMLERQGRRIEGLIDSVTEDLDQAVFSQRQSQKAMEELAQSLQIHEEIIKPSMVDANVAMVAQNRALIRLYTQMYVAPKRPDEMVQ